MGMKAFGGHRFPVILDFEWIEFFGFSAMRVLDFLVVSIDDCSKFLSPFLY